MLHHGGEHRGEHRGAALGLPAGWGPAERARLEQAASKIGTEPASLAAVLNAESGLHPWADNGIAKGLNQITQVAASGWLTERDWENIPKLSILEQLPLVEKSFLKSKAVAGMSQSQPFENAVMLYEANFAPAMIRRGTDDDTVLYRSFARGAANAREDAGYRANHRLDTRGTGQIEVGDLRRYLERSIARSPELHALLNELGGEPNLSGGGSGWFGTLFQVGLGVAGGVLAVKYLEHDRGA